MYPATVQCLGHSLTRATHRSKVQGPRSRSLLLQYHICGMIYLSERLIDIRYPLVEACFTGHILSFLRYSSMIGRDSSVLNSAAQRQQSTIQNSTALHRLFIIVTMHWSFHWNLVWRVRVISIEAETCRLFVFCIVLSKTIYDRTYLSKRNTVGSDFMPYGKWKCWVAGNISYGDLDCLDSTQMINGNGNKEQEHLQWQCSMFHGITDGWYSG